jgi:hypothetical protein
MKTNLQKTTRSRNPYCRNPIQHKINKYTAGEMGRMDGMNANKQQWNECEQATRKDGWNECEQATVE